MNRLTGTITAIESNDHLSLVDVISGRDTYTAMLLETPRSAPHLKVGNTVAILFKETEVSLAKGLEGQISLRNRVRGTVRQIRRGDILCEVLLDRDGQTLTSIITTRAATRLALHIGDEVEALVKANEVSLVEVRDGL
ncbi:MAG: TOBE domain-containing protein [Gallionella sp.]|jgi:molybdate transport system regulatory protein|nr:TOBE domain-containing protein [Gallionella sp.]